MNGGVCKVRKNTAIWIIVAIMILALYTLGAYLHASSEYTQSSNYSAIAVDDCVFMFDANTGKYAVIQIYTSRSGINPRVLRYGNFEEVKK